MCARSSCGRLTADALTTNAPQKLHLTEQKWILPERYLATFGEDFTYQRQRSGSDLREADRDPGVWMFLDMDVVGLRQDEG